MKASERELITHFIVIQGLDWIREHGLDEIPHTMFIRQSHTGAHVIKLAFDGPRLTEPEVRVLKAVFDGLEIVDQYSHGKNYKAQATFSTSMFTKPHYDFQEPNEEKRVDNIVVCEVEGAFTCKEHKAEDLEAEEFDALIELVRKGLAKVVECSAQIGSELTPEEPEEEEPDDSTDPTNTATLPPSDIPF